MEDLPNLPKAKIWDLPKPEIKPMFPTLQVDSLPAEPQGKPKNIGVGSLSLLQGIFPTQELNWCLLYCRWILYELSYQGRGGKAWKASEQQKWFRLKPDLNLRFPKKPRGLADIPGPTHLRARSTPCSQKQ